MTKYKNRRSGGFDSAIEKRYFAQLEAMKKASNISDRVVSIFKQVKFVLIPAQDGERSVTYIADFVVTFADGRREVIDVKSPVTKKLPAYVIKRKLMLFIHGIKIKEVL